MMIIGSSGIVLLLNGRELTPALAQQYLASFRYSGL
jgi:hypothetical protein